MLLGRQGRREGFKGSLGRREAFKASLLPNVAFCNQKKISRKAPDRWPKDMLLGRRKAPGRWPRTCCWAAISPRCSSDALPLPSSGVGGFGAAGATTIKQGIDFIVHLRSGDGGAALHTSSSVSSHEARFAL